jgi:hypothetical protein
MSFMARRISGTAEPLHQRLQHARDLVPFVDQDAEGKTLCIPAFLH